jgi:predicted dehydrogenase
MVNLPWVYHPAVEAVATLVREGSLGPVCGARAVFEHSGPEAWAPEATWYRSGGRASLVLDLGLHVLGVLERLLGSPFDWLSACDGPADPVDRARAVAAMGELSVPLELGWDAPEPRFAVELTTPAGCLTLELVPWAPSGARSVRVSPEAGWSGPALDRDEAGRWWLRTGRDAVGGGPYRVFVDTIRRGAGSPTDVMVMADAIRRMLEWAAGSGRAPATEGLGSAAW